MRISYDFHVEPKADLVGFLFIIGLESLSELLLKHDQGLVFGP